MRVSRSLGLVLAAAAVSGVSVFLNDLFVATIQPSLYTFLKNIVVALLLAALLLLPAGRRELRSLSGAQWARLAVIGLVGGSLPFLLFFEGLRLAQGPMAAFLHKSLFLPVAVLAAIFLRERPNPLWLLGALLLFAGNALALRIFTAAFAVPHFFILGAVLLWAGENVLSKSALEEMSGTVVAFGRMAFGAVFIALFLLASGKMTALPEILTPANGLAIAVSSALLLAYVLAWYNGIAGMRLSDAACLLLVASPITLLLSALARGAAVPGQQALGSFLLLAGAFVVAFSGRFAAARVVRSTT